MVSGTKNFGRPTLSTGGNFSNESVEAALSGNVEAFKKMDNMKEPVLAARLSILHLASAAGHNQMVDHLVNTVSMDPFRTSLMGWTPLHYAVCNGHFDCVKILLRKNMSLKEIKDQYGKKAIDYCTDPTILEFLQSGRDSTAPTLKSLINNTEISSLTLTELRSLSIDIDYFKNKLTLELQKKEKMEISQNFCVVCLEKEKDVLLQPCNHVCVCNDCVRKLESCPMCRTHVTSHTKVFF